MIQHFIPDIFEICKIRIDIANIIDFPLLTKYDHRSQANC